MQQKDYRRSEGLPTDGKEGWGKGIFFAQMLSPWWWKQEGVNAAMHATLYDNSLKTMKMIGSRKRGWVDTSRMINYAARQQRHNYSIDINNLAQERIKGLYPLFPSLQCRSILGGRKLVYVRIVTVLLWPPFLILWQRKIGESRNSNP